MSKYRKPRHKEKESRTKHNPPSHDQNIVQAGQPITPKPPETQNDSRHNEEEHPFWKWLKRAGIVAGIGYAIITWFMYCANKRAAYAAKSAAETSAKQEASWEISQRPWIEVSTPSIIQQQTTPPTRPVVPTQPLLQDDPYSFEVTLRAYGSTPALHSYGKMNPRLVDLPRVVYPFLKNVPPPALDSCAQTAAWEDGPSTYFPTGTYPLLSNSQLASLDDVKNMIFSRKALFWVGCVRYEDAFRRRYQTNFCFYWSGTETPRGWRDASLATI